MEVPSASSSVASATDGGAAAVTVASAPAPSLLVSVRCLGHRAWAVSVPRSCTVAQLKERLASAHPTKPSHASQTILVAGHQVDDEEMVATLGEEDELIEVQLALDEKPQQQQQQPPQQPHQLHQPSTTTRTMSPTHVHAPHWAAAHPSYYAPYGPYPYPSSFASPAQDATSLGDQGLRHRTASSAVASTSGMTEAQAMALATYHQSLMQWQHAMAVHQHQQQLAAHYAGYPTAGLTAAPQSALAYRQQQMMGVHPAAAASLGGSVSAPAPAGSILAEMARGPTQPQQPRAAVAPLDMAQRITAALRAHALLNAQPAVAVEGGAPVPAAAPVNAPPAAAAADAGVAVVAAGVVAPRPNRFGRYLNVQLLLKFIILFFLFTQDVELHRMVILGIAAVLAYLYQVGALRRGGPPEQPEGEEEEDDEMQEFREQQAAEAAAAAPPAPVAPGAAGAAGVVAAAPGPAVIPPAPQGAVEHMEKFIVGFFASIVPSWKPVVVLPTPPPQPAVVQPEPDAAPFAPQ